MRIFFSALFLLSFLWFSSGAKTAPSSFLSQQDSSSLVKKLTASQKSDGSFFGLKNTFFAVASLTQLKAEVPNKQETCNFVNSANIIDAETAYYVFSTAEALGCGKAPSDKVSALLKTALESDSLWNIHHAFSTVILLKEKKGFQIAENSLIAAVSKVIGYAEDDGSFRGSEGDEFGSNHNAGIGLQTLALALSKLNLNKDLKDKIDTILENAISIPSTEESGQVSYNDEDTSFGSLRTTATLFKGINDIAALKKKVKGLSEDVIVGIAEFFISNKGAASPEGIYFFLQGIQTAASSTISRPLVVSFQKDTLSLGSKDLVQVLITDLYGKFATKAKVVLLKAKDADDKILLSNQELLAKKEDPSIYETNFFAVKPEPKLYEFEFRVIAENKEYASIDSATISLQVVGSISVDDFSLAVSDSKEESDVSEGNSFSLTFPKSVKDVLSVQQFQHLFVNFRITSASGKGFNPHQVFLLLVHSQSREEVITIAKPKGAHYSAHINLEEQAPNLNFQSGDYELQLIVGDSFIENSITWKIANLKVKFDERAKEASPFAPKPEIKHAFRPAESRPSKTLSLAFTGAILAAFGILLIGLLAFGANISNFPVGLASFYALGFQGGIAAILFLYVVYWLRLTMVDTLIYLGMLGVPTALFGIKTLNHLSEKKKQE